MKIFPSVIAQDGHRLIHNFVIVATRIAILRREVTINSAPDSLAFRPDCYCLSDLNPAALKNENIAMEIQNALVGSRKYWQQKQTCKKQSSHSTFPSLTSGTFATSSEDFWKNFFSVNRNQPATILLGTVSVRVLYSLTEPL
jgi:hypothetical protein